MVMRMMKEEVDLKESVTKKKTYNQLELGVVAAAVVVAESTSSIYDKERAFKTNMIGG